MTTMLKPKIIFASPTPLTESTGADQYKGGPLNTTEFDQVLTNLQASINRLIGGPGAGASFLVGPITADSINGIVPTALTTGFTLAGGSTTVKTLTVDATVALSALCPIGGPGSGQAFSIGVLTATQITIPNGDTFYGTSGGTVTLGDNNRFIGSKLEIRGTLSAQGSIASVTADLTPAGCRVYTSATDALAKIQVYNGSVTAYKNLVLQPEGGIVLVGTATAVTGAKLEVAGLTSSVGLTVVDSITAGHGFNITPDSSGNTALQNYYAGYMSFKICPTTPGTYVEYLKLSSTGLAVAGDVSATGAIKTNIITGVTFDQTVRTVWTIPTTIDAVYLISVSCPQTPLINALSVLTVSSGGSGYVSLNNLSAMNATLSLSGSDLQWANIVGGATGHLSILRLR